MDKLDAKNKDERTRKNGFSSEVVPHDRYCSEPRNYEE